MRRLCYIPILAILAACSSTRLVSEWSNPEFEDYKVQKVLVLGISADSLIRDSFERRLVTELSSRGIEASASLDKNIMPLTSDDFESADLVQFQNRLQREGFDAILVSKVTGQERRKSVVQSARGLMNEFQTFTDYYTSNRSVYTSAQSESYRVYNAESSVFCICPGQEGNLIWRGRIDIVDPYRDNRNIRDYIRTLVAALDGQELL